MQQSNRRKQPGTTDPLLVLWAIVAAVIVMGLLILLGGLHLGYWWDALDRSVIPNNPFEVIIDLAQGNLAWPSAATVAAAGIGVILGAIVVVFVIDRVRAKRRRRPVDAAAQYMAHGKELAPFS